MHDGVDERLVLALLRHWCANLTPRSPPANQITAQDHLDVFNAKDTSIQSTKRSKQIA